MPSLLCLIIYWPGLWTWFQDDDFAFLGLLPNIHNWNDLWHSILKPTVSGTWRPLSASGYYVLFHALFGANTALPFHIATFLTQFANLILVSALTLRLTGSRLAGFLAPIFWITNSKLMMVMTWCLAYDYALCGFLLLTAFWMFLRWSDTGERRYQLGMWTAYLLGFLALEVDLVFPFLAAAYALLCGKKLFRKTLPLFIPALVFVIADLLLFHRASSGPYRMHVTSGMVKTLARYWAWAFEPVNLKEFTPLPQSAGPLGALVFSMALLGFVAYQAYRKNLLPVFCLCWFAIVLLPVLPLRDNMQDYYLALPFIGVAILAAYAFDWAWRKPLLSKSVASALVAFFMVESVLTAHAGTEWFHQRSLKIRALVRAVAAEHTRQPDKIILLEGVDDLLYPAAVSQHAFAAFGIEDVFLAPGSEAKISPQYRGNISDFVLPAEETAQAASQGRLAVLASEQGNWTDITAKYSPPPYTPSSEKRRRVDVGDLRYAAQLGPEWYGIDHGSRWMSKRASVLLAGPVTKGQKLHVSGYCPAAQVARGPLGMQVSVDGVPLPAVRIVKGDAPFSFEFPLKENSREQIKVDIEVEHTFRASPDVRDLGLVFGVVEIR